MHVDRWQHFAHTICYHFYLPLRYQSASCRCILLVTRSFSHIKICICSSSSSIVYRVKHMASIVTRLDVCTTCTGHDFVSTLFGLTLSFMHLLNIIFRLFHTLRFVACWSPNFLDDNLHVQRSSNRRSDRTAPEKGLSTTWCLLMESLLSIEDCKLFMQETLKARDSLPS